MPIQVTTDLPDDDPPALGNGVEDEIAVDRETQTTNYGDVRAQTRETGQSAWDSTAEGWDEQVLAYDVLTTTVLDREDGEEYELRLRTETEHVTGAWTDPVSIITKFPGATNLAATVASATQIDLSWTDNSDNEDGFRVERREQFTSGWPAWRVQDTVGPNVTTHSHGVTPDTTYEYRIEAFTEHTSATSASVQATTPADTGLTDRAPARGWHVVLEDSSGNVYTPSIVGEPTFRPTLNGLPRVEIPVANPDRWDQPKFDAAPMRVYEDGQRLPIDEFVTVDHSPAQAVLRGRGGSELRQRVERSYESKAVHTASDELVQTTGYVADVDVPATETLTGEVLQEADTTTEFSDNLLTPIASTTPIDNSGGSMQDLQTCFVSEGENETRSGGTTQSDVDDYSNGFAGRLDAAGDYAEFDFTTKHDIPEASVGVAIRDQTADAPELRWYLDDQEVDTLSGSAGSLILGWSDVGDGAYNGTGWSGGTLPAGTYTVRIEIPSGANVASGEYYDYDVVALYDQRYSYTFDNATGANGYLDGPELYPDAVDVVMDDAATAYSVLSADVSATVSNTEGAWQIAVSNDFGATWTTANNTSSLSTSFAERGGSVRTRFRFSRHGSRTTATPKTGFQGQSLDAYTLSGDLDDVATLVNRSYDGNVEDVLADIAEYGDLIWEVRYDGGFKVIVTRPGIRTAAAAAALTDYTVTKDSSETVTKAIVYGKSQPVRAESVTANHGTAVDLGHAHLVETSEVVRDASSGTTYARGIDYSMDEQAGTITTNASGSITDGAALEVDYQYRSRGEHAADTHDGSATKEFATTIPAATTDRACQQAALKIVQTGEVPRWTAEATLDTSLLDVPLSSAIDLEDLPTRDESLEVWSVQDSPRSVTLQLGNREEIAAVVDDIQSRLEAVARLS